jgi:hypothetical protein
LAVEQDFVELSPSSLLTHSGHRERPHFASHDRRYIHWEPAESVAVYSNTALPQLTSCSTPVWTLVMVVLEAGLNR